MTSVDRGVRQDDVMTLVSAILEDESMNLPMIPDVVERVIYQSTVKLTFNLFYKGISQLEGFQIVHSGASAKASGSRELRLDRTHRQTGGGRQQYLGGSSQQWKSFQSSIDPRPLETLATSLLQNEAVNLTVVPDAVEHQLYTNCLKIIFWVLSLLSNTVKISFCGHTLSLDLTPAAASQKMVADFGARHQQQQGQRFNNNNTNNNNNNNVIMSKINSFLVNPQTIQDFSHQVTSLLLMDGNSPMNVSSSNDARGTRGSGLSSWLKSSVTKVHQELIQKLNTSLYGLILAIVDDLMQSTTIDILSDKISLRVVSSSSTATTPNNGTNPTSPAGRYDSITYSNNTNTNMNPMRKSRLNGTDVDDVSWAVQTSLASLGFAEERALLQRRFQEWSPEERAVILRDLQSQR